MVFRANLCSIRRLSRDAVLHPLTVPPGACLEGPVQLVLGDVEERLVVVRPRDVARRVLHSDSPGRCLHVFSQAQRLHGLALLPGHVHKRVSFVQQQASMLQRHSFLHSADGAHRQCEIVDTPQLAAAGRPCRWRCCARAGRTPHCPCGPRPRPPAAHRGRPDHKQMRSRLTLPTLRCEQRPAAQSALAVCHAGSAMLMPAHQGA